MMVSFSDAHRSKHGIEPICAQLPTAPSTYCKHKACEADPDRLPRRACRDQALMAEIRWV
jgi:hypothetical protein